MPGPLFYGIGEFRNVKHTLHTPDGSGRKPKKIIEHGVKSARRAGPSDLIRVVTLRRLVDHRLATTIDTVLRGYQTLLRDVLFAAWLSRIEPFTSFLQTRAVNTGSIAINGLL